MTMNEIKKYLASFVFCVTFLFSLAGIIAGSITARDRVQKVLYGTQYAVLSFSNGNEERKDENTVTVDFEKIKKGLEELLERKGIFRSFAG